MATAWCHWRILPSGSIVREKFFTDVPGEQWEPEMVRRAGGGIGNVSVSQDAKSPPGKICLRISQHALKPDS